MRRKHWPPKGGLTLGLGLSGSGASKILQGFSFTQLSYADYVTSLAATGCTVTDEGLCSDGVNKIYSLSVGPCDGVKPIVMIVGCIHGSEWTNAYSIRQFMTYVATPTSAGAANIYFADIKSKYDFYAIPLANPYGYINSVGCTATIVGGKNVDPNRNYDSYWSIYDDSTNTYSKGSAAESEPETLLVASKIRTLLPILFMEGHMQTGDDIYIYETPWTNAGYWADVNTALTNIGIPSHVYNNNNFYVPMLVNYVRTVLNTNIDRYVNGVTWELGGDNTNIEDSQYTLNFLLQGCLAIQPWADSLYEESITITDMADTCIRSDEPNNNFGIYASSWVGRYSSTFNSRMLVKFDTTRIPAGSTVDSATAYIYCVDCFVSAYNTVALHKALVEWYEGLSNRAVPGAGVDASTWNHRNVNGAVAWGAAGGQSAVDYAAAASATYASSVKLIYYPFNLKTDMQDVADGGSNLGYFVLGEEGQNSTAHNFENKEYGVTYDPYLVVVLK